VEVGTFLTDTARFPNVPHLLGTMEHCPGTGERVVLCVLQRLVENSTDGWNYVASELGRLSDRPAPDEPTARLLSVARKLGARTADLHRAFAAGTDSAFAPEKISGQWLAGWSRSLVESVGAVCARLQDQRPTSAQENRGSEPLLSRRRELIGRINALMPAKAGVMRTRLHGDFHLGQTLVAEDDVFIVDFEGEPMRPLAERRGKYLPLRDVAGMLRSFDYACATEIRRLEPGAGELDRLKKIAGAMKSAFLEEYRRAISGCPSFPRDMAQADNFLHLCLIEKTLYEINYELANRPDWVPIPIDGLISILNDEQVPSFRSVKPTEAEIT